MQKQHILQMLELFQPSDDTEAAMLERIVSFIGMHENYMDRELRAGHITGSAWILDKSRRFALMTHHRKLNRWLQLGGHAEGETSVLDVAVREALEESGLSSIRLLDEAVFSVDVHLIPASSCFPEHPHYDIRFLFEADMDEPFEVSEESHDLRWIPLEEIERYNADTSVLRMVAKTLRAV